MQRSTGWWVGGALPDELVPHPMHGDEVARVRRLVLDLLAQLGHVHVDGAGERDRVVAPDRVEQLLAGDHLAPVLGEVLEQPELARRQVDRPVALGGLVALEVDGDVAEREAARTPAWDRAARRSTASTRAISSMKLNGFVT